MAVRIEDFAAETFRPHIGRKLVFLRPAAGPEAGRKPVALDLIEVKYHEHAAPSGRRQPFSLLFTLREDAPLGQGLHQLVHASFEPCDLFLARVQVPELDRNDGTMFFEAVFG